MTVKRDRKIYIATVVSVLFFALVSALMLPDRISLLLDGTLKSRWYLVLFSAVPLLSTFMLEKSNGGQRLEWKVFFPVEIYSLLVVVDALFIRIRMEHLMLVFLALLFFYLSRELRDKDSHVKIQLKWIEKDSEDYIRAQKKGERVFLAAAIVTVIAFLLLLAGAISTTVAFASGILAFFLGSFYIIRTGV